MLIRVERVFVNLFFLICFLHFLIQEKHLWIFYLLITNLYRETVWRFEKSVISMCSGAETCWNRFHHRHWIGETRQQHHFNSTWIIGLWWINWFQKLCGRRMSWYWWGKLVVWEENWVKDDGVWREDCPHDFYHGWKQECVELYIGNQLCWC